MIKMYYRLSNSAIQGLVPDQVSYLQGGKHEQFKSGQRSDFPLPG